MDQFPESAPKALTMLCIEIKDCNGAPFAVIQVLNKRRPAVAGKLADFTPAPFTEQDEAMLALLGIQAASVLRCCDLHLRNSVSKGYVDQLRKYDRVEIERLVKTDVDEVLVKPWSGEEKLMMAAAAKIKMSIKAEHCTVFLRQEDGLLWTPFAGKGGKMERVRLEVTEDTTAGWCAARGEGLNVKNLALDERFNKGMTDQEDRDAAMLCSIMCVPILKTPDDAGCRDGVLGVIEVIRTGHDRVQMGAFEAEYLSDLSRHLLSALARARETLMQGYALDCARLLSRQTTVEGALAVVKGVVQRCLGRAVCTRTFKIDHEHKELVCSAAIGASREEDEVVEERELRGSVEVLSLEGHVAREARSIRVTDARLECHTLADGSCMANTLDPHTGLTGRADVAMPILCVPVKDEQGRVAAVLQVIGQDEKGDKVVPFTENDERVVEMIGVQLRDMMGTFRAVSDALLHQRDLHHLVTSLPELFAEFDLHRLCRLVAAQTCRLLGATHCTPYVVDQATGELWTLIEGYSREVRLPKGMGMVGAAAQSAKEVYVADCSEQQGIETIISEAGAKAGVRSMLLCPVVSGAGVVLAVVQAFHPKPDAFDGHKRSLQSSYTRLVGVAFDNQALASRRVRDIQRGISVEWEPSRVHHAVREAVLRLMACEWTALFQLEASGQGLFSHQEDPSHHHGGQSRTGAARAAHCRRFPLGKGIVGRVFASGDAILTEAAQFLPAYDGEIDSAGGKDVKGLLCVPVANGSGERVGVLVAANKRKGRFTRDDEALFKLLAAQWGESVSNNAKYARAQATIRCNSYMLKATRALTSVTDARGLVEGLAEQVRGLIASSERCTVFIVDQDNRDLVTYAASGDEVRLPISRATVAGFAADTGELVRVQDVYTDDRFAKLSTGGAASGSGPMSMLSWPVRVSGQVVAVIQIMASGGGEGFSHKDEEDLRSVGEQVAGGSMEVYSSNRMAHRLVGAMTTATALSSDLGMRVGGLPSNIKRAVRQVLECDKVNIFLVDVIEQELVKDLAADLDEELELFEGKERSLRLRLDSMRARGDNGTPEYGSAERSYMTARDALLAVRKRQAKVEGVTQRLQFGHGLAGRVAQSGGTINTGDASAEKLEFYEAHSLQGADVATALTTCAYSVSGHMIAVIQALNKKQGKFTAEDEAVLDKLSIQAAMMLQHAQQMQRLEKRSFSRSNLGGFLVRALPCETVEQVIQMVNFEASVAILVGARQVVLHIYDGGAKTLLTVNKYGESVVAPLNDLATSVAGQAAVSGEVVEQMFSTQGEVDGEDSDEPEQKSELHVSTRHSSTVRSCRIGQPVMGKRKEGVLLGVIECVNKKGGVFDDEDREALELLSSVVAGLIEVLRFEHDLRLELELAAGPPPKSPKKSLSKESRSAGSSLHPENRRHGGDPAEAS